MGKGDKLQGKGGCAFKRINYLYQVFIVQSIVVHTWVGLRVVSQRLRRVRMYTNKQPHCLAVRTNLDQHIPSVVVGLH